METVKDVGRPGRLTKEQVRDIYFHNTNIIGQGPTTLARKYDIGIKSIYRIRDGRQYKKWTEEFEAERYNSYLQSRQLTRIRAILAGQPDPIEGQV